MSFFTVDLSKPAPIKAFCWSVEVEDRIVVAEYLCGKLIVLIYYRDVGVLVNPSTNERLVCKGGKLILTEAGRYGVYGCR